MTTDDEPLPRLISTYSGDGQSTFEFKASAGCRVSLRRSVVLGWQEADHRCVLFTMAGNILADHPYDEISEVLQ